MIRQRSPGKRTLSDSSDRGNSAPRSSAGSSSDDVENRVVADTSPTETFPNSASKGSWLREDDKSFSPFRALARNVSLNGAPAKSSPLKRSDGIMNLDQAGMGSPSAKRRSLHGASFGADFDIFDHEAALQGGRDAWNTDSNTTSDSVSASEPSTSFSPLPKRTSSLRRTTLQQRHDKPAFVRSRLNMDTHQDVVTPGQTTTKSKFRQSLGNMMPSRNRESPFSFQGNLPSASAHPMSQQNPHSIGSGTQVGPSRHPLSRTMTQSSSNSSLAEDSPTHPPIRNPGPRRPLVDFSKSLPVVGQKPPAHGQAGNIQSSQRSSNESSIATPENYRLARPHPAAFASTGLISKRHKNVDDTQSNFNPNKSLMPDTPCKRHSLMGAPTPSVAPSVKDVAKDRRVRHSFGTPSTPFNPYIAQAESGAFGKGVSIFGSNVLNGSLHRRASFLSVEGDENSQSPVGKGESQSSTEFEFPPTPTKQTLVSGSLCNASMGQSSFGRLSTLHGTGAPTLPNIGSAFSDQACKSFPVGLPLRDVEEDSDNVMDESPSVALRFRNSLSVPSSFTRSRRLTGNLKSPTPLNRVSHTLPSLSSKKFRTKRSPLSPASPISDLFERLSPRTPRDSVVPPDPSHLSISAHGDGGARPMEGITSSSSVVPPATPTMIRDSFPQLGVLHSSTTPLKNFQPAEMDQSLISRFDKVEIVGTGEFSQVYRCSKAQEGKGYFSFSTGRASPKAPLPDRVWAVKKSRKPFLGLRDRERKLQEVRILRSMTPSDHVLRFIDSWEEKSHLYIQTEFCEEGTLDVFLVQEGRKGRLDDFRIWKVMSELALGLKHIHDSGFIHLDLKPANVLITFEGTLKIADFGMAASWPAQPGIEGEGDREYIGPEVLKGQYDKPADIFALGLIILEIAGNVQLPDNGVSWQRLRNGDISDVPSLTFSSEGSSFPRDLSESTRTDDTSFCDFYSSDSSSDFGDIAVPHRPSTQHKHPTAARYQREGELAEPPNFMVDGHDPDALDNIVRWLIAPEPSIRPAAHQVLAVKGAQWAARRARAGATVYEGLWGPADEVLADDSEMIDV